MDRAVVAVAPLGRPGKRGLKVDFEGRTIGLAGNG